MYDRVGNVSKANQWRKVASDRKAALKNVFFDPYTSSWRDVDIDDTSSASNFYPSTLTPIWARAQHQSPEETLNIYKRLWPKIIFPGGMPTSLINSKQQWDFPNAWAPLQQFVIDGLDSLNLPEATQMADQLANVWFTTNYCAWLQSLPDGGLFFEKYDVTKVGSAGGGGEYKVQAGFGWTNGVLLKLLATRGSRLEIGPCH
jgi:alpha,alpha-trehalase